MSSDPALRAPPRRRRTHSERTAETRARVISAVVESIDEVGFHRTTGSEIARRAGVSWGAIQHHFRDKDGILVAALEASYRRFAETLGSPPPDSASLAERVSLFVDRAWSHFSSPEYRSTSEILINLPAELDEAWVDGLTRDWARVWADYFPRHRASRRRVGELMQYSFAVLAGLAASRMLERRGSRVRATGLDYLKDTLVRGLAEEGSRQD